MTPEKHTGQLGRMKREIGNGHARDALSFVNGPKFGRYSLRNLFKTEGCMWASVVHKQEFNKCLNCSRLDRSNMVCTVGRAK